MASPWAADVLASSQRPGHQVGPPRGLPAANESAPKTMRSPGRVVAGQQTKSTANAVPAPTVQAAMLDAQPRAL